MSDTSYNGWTNYPTWCVALWIDNDPHWQTMCDEVVTQAMEDAENCEQVRDGIWTPEEAARFHVADDLKAWLADDDCGMLPDLGASMAADLLGWALDNVNWNELADNYIASHVAANFE